ncbi:hypothetical protein [uncultured Lutibacter sp.]|uniref:hypothetical protein n=1 Tax=uncultured Lutibacter sp. TaxID=437739 RepID=UPI00261FB95D|nr:hypothetical protein [uncultured Lutibacter sp.]
MKNISKIFEYGYLIIAVVFLVETVLNWNTDRSRSYLLLVFAILAIFMYFFKKRFRARMENRTKD